LYGVYDGHCGKDAAESAAMDLHRAVLSELEALAVEAQTAGGEALSPEARTVARTAAIQKAFLAHDASYLARAREESWYSGSTAVVCLLSSGAKLTVAHLGDSSAFLARRVVAEPATKTKATPPPDNAAPTQSGAKAGGGGAEAAASEAAEAEAARVWYEAVPLTEEHKPDRPDEQQRVEDAGGWVTEEQELFMGQLHRMDLDDPEIESQAESVVKWTSISRVCGELAVSRSLGDPDFKGFGPKSHTAPPDDLFFPFPEVASALPRWLVLYRGD